MLKENNESARTPDGPQDVLDRGGREDRPSIARGLSSKVLALTILFVMIGEVLIFLPSIANFRITWLKNKIAIAELTAMALEASEDNKLSDELRQGLLRGAGVKVIALKRGNTRQLVLRAEGDHMIAESFDLPQGYTFSAVTQAFYTLAVGGDRVIGVVDNPPDMTADFIELALDEAPLRSAMVTYSVNILALSIILSLIVAALVFISLNYALVRPIRRLTRNMVMFSEHPEDARRIISPSGRRDEIGVTERQLHNMQTELAGMLQQKSRLAALGLAVSKVSHDLRNMLATAQLISDRLSVVDDPTVQKFAPKLIASLDRAIEFCAQTLKFGRAQEAPPRREQLSVHEVAEEVVNTAISQTSSQVVIYNSVDPDIIVDADREHLFRILMNLLRNAGEALDAAMLSGSMSEGTVKIDAWRNDASTVIEVRDNGPGVPEKARAHLFEAFRGSARAGGTGLGLTIAQELAGAHGGDVRLLHEDGAGAVFHVTIPDGSQDDPAGRRGRRERTSATQDMPVRPLNGRSS